MAAFKLACLLLSSSLFAVTYLAQSEAAEVCIWTSLNRPNGDYVRVGPRSHNRRRRRLALGTGGRHHASNAMLDGRPAHPVNPSRVPSVYLTVMAIAMERRRTGYHFTGVLEVGGHLCHFVASFYI